MNNILSLVAISLLLNASFVAAQDPMKEVKRADRLLGLYYLDTKLNIEKLWEAKTTIDAVAENPAVSETYKYNLTLGQIYNAVANSETDSMLIYETTGKNYKLKYPLAAITAYKAFLKAKKVAVKDYEHKEVLNSLAETGKYLNNFGSMALNKTKANNELDSDYKLAYENFEAVIVIDKMLRAETKQFLLSNNDDLLKQKYIAAACAVNANMTAQVIPTLEELRAASYPEPLIYESLFNYYLSINETQKAEAVLNEGRSKLPNDKSLLYAEINYFLKLDKLSEIIDKLKHALTLEPDNITIYNTLGNVYDNMCQKEWEQGFTSKGEELFKEAESYYTTGLRKNSEMFELNYNLGALYYNKAALISKEANKLSSDYSKEGTRKYNEKRAEMESYFEKALPYLEKAEQLDAKDRNTLIALKEIYARKGLIDKSNMYKAKLESVGTDK